MLNSGGQCGTVIAKQNIALLLLTYFLWSIWFNQYYWWQRM